MLNEIMSEGARADKTKSIYKSFNGIVYVRNVPYERYIKPA